MDNDESFLIVEEPIKVECEECGGSLSFEEGTCLVCSSTPNDYIKLGGIRLG